MRSILSVGLSLCLSVCVQDYCKSNQPISLKLGVMSTNRKNWLTFGDDPVPDTDSGSLFHFRHHLAGGLALSFLSENFTQKSRWPVLLTSFNKSQAILCRTLRFEKLRTVFGHVVCFATTTTSTDRNPYSADSVILNVCKVSQGHSRSFKVKTKDEKAQSRTQTVYKFLTTFLNRM